MSRQNTYNKKAFFNSSIRRAEMFQKRRKDIAMAKKGEVVADPKEVVESTGEVVPDPEVVEGE